MPTQDEIQQRFPIGDYIEYQTGKGFFSGKIVGYRSYTTGGISLDLGDRRIPVTTSEQLKMAEKWHKSAKTKAEEPKIIKAPQIIQLTLF
jgi:hypothetical protein